MVFLGQILASEALSTALITLLIALIGWATLKTKNATATLHKSLKAVESSLHSQGEDIREAREQVTNNHGTNFRDDLDGFRAEFKLQMNDVRQMVAKREAASAERESRLLAWQSSLDDRILLLDQKVENLKNGSSRTHDRMWKEISKIEKRRGG